MDLTTIVQREVEAYAGGHWHKARAYALSDLARQRYAVVSIPDRDYPIEGVKPGLVIMARVVGDVVVIEHDITDEPLFEALIQTRRPA